MKFFMSLFLRSQTQWWNMFLPWFSFACITFVIIIVVVIVHDIIIVIIIVIIVYDIIIIVIIVYDIKNRSEVIKKTFQSQCNFGQSRWLYWSGFRSGSLWREKFWIKFTWNCVFCVSYSWSWKERCKYYWIWTSKRWWICFVFRWLFD